MECLFTNGIDLRTRRPLWEKVPFDEFLRAFRDRLPSAREDFARRLLTTQGLSTAYNIFKAATSPNLNDPLQVGYGVICAPAQASLLDGPLASLLRLRQVKPEHRLVFDRAQPGDLSDWVDAHITFQDGPYYWLLIGGPDDLPFDLQWTLDAGKATGRIVFATTDDYAAYADRIARAEGALTTTQGQPPAFFWAPLHDGPTRLSKWYMCDPLVASLRSRGLTVDYAEAADATREAFWKKAEGWGTRAGLVYTASHGGALPKDDPQQEKLQGCLMALDDTVTGEQVAGTRGAFSQSVVFNFACYSGGTPSHSDFNHWVPAYRLDQYIPQVAFISSLHRRLLAHPAGPLACIGHVEPAWIHSFLDPANPDDVVRDPSLDVEWGERMQPFRMFVSRLLQGSTVGYAMEQFGFLYNELGNDLARRIDRFVRLGLDPAQLDQELRKMVMRWISRNDYQNYVVFGDPAVRIV